MWAVITIPYKTKLTPHRIRSQIFSMIKPHKNIRHDFQSLYADIIKSLNPFLILPYTQIAVKNLGLKI